ANAAVAVDVYDDVDGTEWYADDVQWGLDSGILDETQAFFRAGDNASRAEYFKMNAAGAGIPEAACDETLFPDLDADHWGCGWVTALAEAGIVSGDGPDSLTPGHVRPNDNILRAAAGKVTVESYGLLGSSMGSDVFGDVEAGVWYDEYAGTAYDNCVFQGVGSSMNLEPGRNIVRAEAIAVVHRGANPTSDCQTAVVTAGALTVSVDGSTPDSQLIPRNANSVPYVVWGLEASNDEDILIEELTVSRVGLGDPEDFDELRLYVGVEQQGSKKNINSTTNDATFALAGDPIEVPAGGKLLLLGEGDMSANENAENALCIASPDDVFAVGADSGAQVDVGGSFAACGEYMYTGSATVGDLTYAVSDFGGDINVGDMDVDMARLRLEVDGEDGLLQRIVMKQTGSADPDDFANTMWYYSNAPVEGLACDWSGDYYGCDFAASSMDKITDGGVINLNLRSDVVGGIGNDAAFDIHRDTDIFAIGGQHGFGLNVAEDGSSQTSVAREIVGGRLAFAASSNNPTVGDIAPNAEDHDFLGFNIATAGDAVDLSRFDMQVNYDGAAVFTEVDDLKVWQWDDGMEAWKIAAGSIDPGADPALCTGVPAGPGECTLVFEDTISLPAAGTEQFMATMDADGDATAGAFFWVNLLGTPGTFEAEYTVDDDPVDRINDVSGLPIVGHAQTVAPPHLTVDVSSSPWDQTVVKNQAEVDLVGYDLTASTASDLIVRTLELTCTDVAGPGTCDDLLTNTEMFHKDGGSLFFLDDTNFAGNAGVFNNLNLDVFGGQTEKVLTRSDVTSSPTNTDIVAFEILLDSDVSADDEFGFALTGTQVDLCIATTEGCFNGEGEAPEIAFRDNGQLEVSIEDTLSDDIILDGTTNVKVAEITLRETTDAEDVLLRELRLTNNVDGGACTTSGVSTVKIAYPDSDPDLGYSASLKTINSVAEFSFQSTGDKKVTVPRDGKTVLPVYVDTNSIGSGGAVSGDCINLALLDIDGDDYDRNPLDNVAGVGGDTDLEAVGASSGELLDNPSVDIVGTSGYDGFEYYDSGAETFTIRNNRPTINTLFEYNQTGNPEVYGYDFIPSDPFAVLAFEVAVEGDDTARLYDIQLGATSTCTDTTPFAGANDHYLYLESEWLDAGTDTVAHDADFDGIFTYVAGPGNEFEGTSTGLSIDAVDGSETYVVAIDAATDYGCIFDDPTLDTLEFWIDTFSWDDGKATVL
ncbi:S-layer homology domain-containing protein, partial [Patescibacteria group bacterium]